MKLFEVGKVYKYGFIGDSDLEVPVLVERRTEKSIWINGERKKIHNDKNYEWVYPKGQYSMAPVLTAK